VVLEGGGIRNDKEVTSGIGKSIFPTPQPPPPPSPQLKFVWQGGGRKTLHVVDLICFGMGYMEFRR
jgi:hypothetical protein